ncbi:calmegin [Erpetoichthys calabaricus]|uniref:Calmegin n=1 Tax=Erpetoichthys calabaricus TaxID=27687 RepID=A0A8C4RI68_ERPCA|nr:calmegin [Erpetoichthys calabaricus]XP_051784201.1 calmegin [Erpetoichthys calabaricus]
MNVVFWACVVSPLLAVGALSHEDGHLEEEGDDSEESPSDNQDIADDSKFVFQVTYKTPVPVGEVYFSETFDHGSLDGWFLSKTKKGETDDEIAKYDGKWAVETLKENAVPGDKGLVLKSRAKHHAIASMVKTPFVFDKDPLVVQYEVNFQDGIDCGGAYMKLLTASDDLNLEQFFDRTPYTIMFGPDKCGEDYKLHFIFRHKSPITGEFEEKHAKRPEVDLKKYYTDKKTHLYTLVLNPDNTFEIFIDQNSVSTGSLFEDMVPPVNPPKEIDDPNDSKPDDWDERPKIPDPDASKPDDWDENVPAKIEDPDAVKPEGWLDDEPEYISDPSAEKPVDWDEEMDGEWEAPQIPNPECEKAPGCGPWKRPMINNPNYKGKWKPPLIENPNYQGIWKPRKIPNPDYFEDDNPFGMTPFTAVGLELWSMTSDIYFDNFIICSEKEVSDRWASDSWGVKKLVASANEPGVWSQLISAADERPWLWIIYILTIALPLGLIALFCWPRKAGSASLKKTDAPQLDEKREDGDNEEEIKLDEAGNTVDHSVKGRSMLESHDQEHLVDAPTKETGQLDKREEENGIVGKMSQNDEEDEEEEDDGNKSQDTASEDEMKDADEGTEDGPVQPVRKRRVRKD